MGDERYRFGNVNGPVQIGDGVQNIAGGDQYIAGRDQVVHGGPSPEVLAELANLRQALAELRLTPVEQASAEQDLEAMEGALRRPGPHAEATSKHLQSFTGVLKDAGALASAGNSLGESIAKIARALGPVAAGVLALL